MSSYIRHPIEDCGEYLRVPLTRGKYTLIDKRDSHLGNYKWCFSASRYAQNGSGSKSIRLHHAICGYPILKNMCVDHINGDFLDNRRKNLRLTTYRENAQNMTSHRNGKLPGALFRNGKWRAQIWFNGKNHWIGSFGTQEEARSAYLRESEKLEGAKLWQYK